MPNTAAIFPKARSQQIVVQELPDETLVYDLKRHKALCLNRAAGLVWKRCDGQTSAPEIAALLEGNSRHPWDNKSFGSRWDSCRRLACWKRDGSRRLLLRDYHGGSWCKWACRRHCATGNLVGGSSESSSSGYLSAKGFLLQFKQSVLFQLLPAQLR